MKENAQMLFRMETQTFNRTFDCPSRNKEETMSYLKNAKTYFAYQGSNVVGVFSYYESKDNIEIKLFFVLNEHQGKGFGIEMMNKLLELTNVKCVWLVVHPKNTVAIITYLKSGFILSEWKNNYYGDGQPRLRLTKMDPRDQQQRILKY